MARSKSSAIDKARQAIFKIAKGAVKENRKKLNQLERTRKAALKQHRKNLDRDLVAQWRALARYGYISTTAKPSQKNLTESRRKAIRKAFTSAQSQGTLVGGTVKRPLERVVKTTTTRWRNAKGYEYITTKTSIKYGLEDHFKIIKTKKKVNVERGVRKTKKGYVVEVQSPLSKVRVNKKGQVIEKTEYKSGAIEITREGITGEEILRLVDQIEKGKFKLPARSALKFDNFGTDFGRAYQSDALDLLAERVRYYERAMSSKVFEHWMASTELHIIRVA